MTNRGKISAAVAPDRSTAESSDPARFARRDGNAYGAKGLGCGRLPDRGAHRHASAGWMPMLWPRLAWRSAEPVYRPTGDHVGEPVDEVLVDLEAKWCLSKLLGVAHENAALAEQP